ncbi:hypothetical protein [Pedobacter sp.]|uniref:hypothetical protein n=1 Tax=Pedobacter sp. TaxID=1411316 RepID=UPI003D7F6D90
MMFIFPLLFIVSFIMSLREIIRGNKDGMLLFLIFGLSMYTTAMSVAFSLGLKDLIPVFQFFKELMIFSVLGLNIMSLTRKPRFHVLDYMILAFFLYSLLYALAPIGEQSFINRLMAFKSMSFFVLVYFSGRFLDLRNIYVNKYFNYIMILTIAAGVVLIGEYLLQTHLQTMTGYAEYSYYFFNFEPSGSYGLTTTFESEGGYKRFASFFANPLEHAAATLLALAFIMALYTRDDNKLVLTPIGMTALAATFISITLALSRAPFASYFVMIYFYALLTRKKLITNIIHIGFGLVAAYVAYLMTRFEDTASGIMEVVVNTVDFSNPSSVGHLVEWIQGIMAMIESPLGLGLGTSGRVAGSLGENIGGENQFIIIGVQAGVIAMFLYLFIYLNFIRLGIKWLPYLKGKERKICMAVLFMKIGFFIPLLTSEVESSSYISYMNWFFSGMMMTIIMSQGTAPYQESAAEISSPKPNIPATA